MLPLGEDWDNSSPTSLSALVACTRETDVIGWYKNQSIVGVMFTELVIDDRNSILSTMLTRVSKILQDSLTFEQFNQIRISFHFFPDKWDHDIAQRPSNPTLYPDLSERDTPHAFLPGSKRMMDIVGSGCRLLICTPIFLIIALAIKARRKAPYYSGSSESGNTESPSHS